MFKMTKWLINLKKRNVSSSENNFLDSLRITVKMLPNSIFNFYLHLSFLCFFSHYYIRPRKYKKKINTGFVIDHAN